MILKPSKTLLNCSCKELFDFLVEVSHFKLLMPENIERFEIISEKSFLFQLSGMPEIKLQLEDVNPYEKIRFISISDKVSFSIDMNLIMIDDFQSEVELLFEGNFNPMLSMMVKKPLKNFLNNILEKLESRYK